AWFILRPWLSLWDLHVAVWWPAALAVATLAWFQALLWSPVGLRGIRIVLVTAVILGLIAFPQYSLESGASEGFLAGLFSGLAGLAGIVGYVGVRHARRGDIPDWGRLVPPLRRIQRGLPRRRAAFAAAAQAQVWFEWRRSGLTLPLLTGVVLPF